jgi:hypothetical protein
MRGLLFTGITFGVFMTEAIIHYNMGMSKVDGKFRLRLPPPDELAKIAAVTGAFSLVSGALVRVLEQRLVK